MQPLNILRVDDIGEVAEDDEDGGEAGGGGGDQGQEGEEAGRGQSSGLRSLGLAPSSSSERVVTRTRGGRGRIRPRLGDRVCAGPRT